MTVGDRIRQRRMELGLTQAELGAKLGYNSRTAISNVEKGKEDLTTTRVRKFADALGVTPAYLMGWEDEPSDYLVNLASVYSPQKEISLDIEKHIDTTKALTAYAEILSYYKKLDETGKQDLLKYAKYLASNKESMK